MDVVANSTMNRERGLRGVNSYVRDLGVDPLDVLLHHAVDHPADQPLRWLDLCCGRALALVAAAEERRAAGAPAVRITGLDLVDAFAPEARGRDDLELVCAS